MSEFDTSRRATIATMAAVGAMAARGGVQQA